MGVDCWLQVDSKLEEIREKMGINPAKRSSSSFVIDIGISILIYITYDLYCLQLLLVTLYSAFIGLDHFWIIE
jgi:hypothetical protein